MGRRIAKSPPVTKTDTASSVCWSVLICGPYRIACAAKISPLWLLM
jgi:hypothetical protein